MLNKVRQGVAHMNLQASSSTYTGNKAALRDSAVCGALSSFAVFNASGVELAPWLKYLLFKWCYRRFQQHIPTTELMNTARSLQEKMVIAIVAMMDVDSASLRQGLNPTEWSMVEACHGYLQHIDWRH